ncbi:MAG: DUF3341 domain-containing protein [Planctomycetes bacterium]|nr:DUF3341 domain-containing protein [Planctomycetota bacterium]
MSRRLHIAAFDDGHALLRAAAACRAQGLPLIDAFLPHPVHGLDEVMAIRPTRLPIVCFAGGVVGLSLALWFQYWSSATDWPLDVGGKPFDSFPAFVPVAFELLVLGAGLLTAATLLVRSRLWPGARSRIPDPRVTDDRYVLVVGERGAAIAPAAIDALLLAHGALDCREELEAATEASR